MILFWSILFFITGNEVLSEKARFKRQEDGSRSCISPDGNLGLCISVRKCPALLELLKRSITNSTATDFLRRSLCGGYAEVCCASQEDSNIIEIDKATGPNASVWGRSPVRQRNRIAGLKPANLGAWPWIAALGYTEINSSNRDVMWRCGGSLINKRYILTAAHCILTPPELSIQLSVVRLGELDLSNDTEGANPIDFGVEKTIVHEDYASQTNDIALVRLDQDVAFSDEIRPINLPVIAALWNSSYERKYPFVVGWGTNLNGTSSDVLLEVQVPVIDNESCRQAYTRNGSTITTEHLCAGKEKRDYNSCRGDSGGPLMLPHGGGIYYQIGIFSYIYHCEEPGYPGVYTRVSSYIDWIKNNTNGLSQD